MTTYIAIQPHGGELVDRLLDGPRRDELRALAQTAPRIELSEVGLSDLELIATGAYSPLRGFMGRADYQRVLDEMRLADDTLWPIPITLPVTEAVADSLHEGDIVALHAP